MMFYFTTFTLKCFVLAVTTVSVGSNIAKQNLQNFTISVPLCYFCARRPILRAENRRILTSLGLISPPNFVIVAIIYVLHQMSRLRLVKQTTQNLTKVYCAIKVVTATKLIWDKYVF